MQQSGRDYQPEEDFELNGTHGKTHVIESQVLYETDDQWSDCVDLRGYRVVGLIIPAALDAGATTFQLWVSDVEDVPYAVGAACPIINTATGAALDITLGATPGVQAIGAGDLLGVEAFRWVKIYLSASQTGDRTFQWIVKG